MAQRQDPSDNSIVIDGFENGIADSPYTGIGDMRNANIISIPGEASVNFATTSLTASSYSGMIVGGGSASSKTFYVSSTTLETGQAVIFSASNFATPGDLYWVERINATEFKIHTSPFIWSGNEYATSDTATGTFSTVDMGLPKYFTNDTKNNKVYMLDSNGRVWGNWTTTGTTGAFVYVGNKVPTAYKAGNGLVYYESSDHTGYVFIFHDSSIDYFITTATAPTIEYQWAILAGTVGTYNTSPTKVLQTALGTHNSHEAMVGVDNRVYFCDSNWISVFYQADPAGTAFNPKSIATYTFDTFPLLPFNDTTQCLAQLGSNLLIGGKNNIIYTWNKVDLNYNGQPILLAESNIQKMVTVNTNTYALVGNRGRIYVTNGSQAQLWKKIPDHISGIVEPYFTWGGLCSQKNQIFFSAQATSNNGATLVAYGGVWAIDVDTQAIRLTNKLSYGSYAGYASALIADVITNPAGTGLYIGWYDGGTTYGIDKTSANLYQGSETVIESDLIPIGTYDNPKNFTRVDYKLVNPMATGESVSMYYRLRFGDGWTLIYTSDNTTSDTGYSESHEVNFQNAQWVQLKIVLTSI